MVRLTDYVTSGGCACKIGPHILERVLKAVTPVINEHVLADMTGADDAGVYQISDRLALVQTLDFSRLLSMTLRYSVKLQRLMH